MAVPVGDRQGQVRVGDLRLGRARLGDGRGETIRPAIARSRNAEMTSSRSTESGPRPRRAKATGPGWFDMRISSTAM